MLFFRPMDISFHVHAPVVSIDMRTTIEHSLGVPTCQLGFFPMPSAPNPQSDADQLEAAADQALAACDGDAREAVKALIVANAFLETKGCGLDGLCARSVAAA
jgi:hypothetical protein